MNQITVTGLVATEPRHIITPEGLDITSFRLAAQERRFDRDQQMWISGETNWFTVTGFRNLGANSAASVFKGDRVVVVGRLRLKTWGDNNGMTAEIEAESLGHDLRWGTSSFSRNFSSARTEVESEDSDDENDSCAAGAEVTVAKVRKISSR